MELDGLPPDEQRRRPGGACGKQYGESCPPPPPGAPPLPSRSPSMSQPRPPAADWLDYRFNAFG